MEGLSASGTPIVGIFVVLSIGPLAWSLWLFRVPGHAERHLDRGHGHAPEDHSHGVDQPSTHSGWHTHLERFAVASLVCSLLGFVTGLGALLGIVFGLIARARIRKSESLSGRRLAMSGIIIGLVALATTAGVVTFLINRPSGSGAAPESDVVVSGSPKSDVRLAEQELLPESIFPANWTSGDGSTEDSHDSFFGSGSVQTSTVAQLAHCVGVDPATIDLDPAEAAGQMYGPDANNVDLNDTVDVYPTKADALIDITAATSPRVDACLLQFEALPGAKQLSEGDKTYSSPFVTQRPIVSAGDHDVDIEISYPWAIGRTHATDYFDTIIVQRGRSESNLTIETWGAQAPTSLALVDRMVEAAAQHMQPG